MPHLSGHCVHTASSLVSGLAYRNLAMKKSATKAILLERNPEFRLSYFLMEKYWASKDGVEAEHCGAAAELAAAIWVTSGFHCAKEFQLHRLLHLAMAGTKERWTNHDTERLLVRAPKKSSKEDSPSEQHTGKIFDFPVRHIALPGELPGSYRTCLLQYSSDRQIAEVSRRFENLALATFEKRGRWLALLARGSH
jgi:hypothetical protein